MDPGSAQLPNLPASCLLAGTNDVDRQANFSFVAYYYVKGLENDCWGRLLNAALTIDQEIDWSNYLFNYTSALFGCGLVYEPLPGGVDEFGLSNTDVVGVPGPMLSPDDASILIDRYMEICVAQLDVPLDILEPLRARLEQLAIPRIDASAASWLAECPAPIPEIDP